MPNRAVKLAVALSIVFTAPAASLARGGQGGPGGQGGFARLAGSAGTGNVPISGIPRGPANAGGMNNATVDPSGTVNAFRTVTLPPNAAGWFRKSGRTSADELRGAIADRGIGGRAQPRADQVPSENDLMNPKNPINQENARPHCRGC